MPSLLELVERVNKGESVEAGALDSYLDSANAAERFLAHHARATIELRSAQQHLMQSLEAIDYGDQKVLSQFLGVSSLAGAGEYRCAPIARFGAGAIARRDYALGVEAIQSGLAYDLNHGSAYSNDRDNCLNIASHYEKAAVGIGFTAMPRKQPNAQPRIAYVCSQIADDDAACRAMLGLAKACESAGQKMSVYCTEAFVRRERQQFIQPSYVGSSSKRGRDIIDQLSRCNVTVWTAPTDGDAVSAAKEMATQLGRDQVDVALFDVNQSDAAANIVAAWNVAPVRLAIARRSAIYCSNLDGICYLDPVRHEADQSLWQSRNIQCWFMPEGIDPELIPQTQPQRSAFGIPDGAVVLATACPELERAMNEQFVDCVISILRANPQAIYLAAGEGELSAAKRRFESAGVTRRVGWVGKRKDVASFLRIADVYLAEFPTVAGTAGSAGILGAMSIACPVVAMKAPEGTAPSGQPSLLTGEEACVSPRDANAYAERVGKLIADGEMRSSMGQSMLSRVQQHFSFEKTARQLEQTWTSMMSGGAGNTGHGSHRSRSGKGSSMKIHPSIADDDDLLVQVA